MLRSLIILPLALLLAACGALPLLLGGLSAPAPQVVQTASAPLARTTVDESGFRAALSGARALAASVRVAVAARAPCCIRNSPRALQIQRGLIALQSALRSGRSLLDLLNNPVQQLSLDEFERKRAEFVQAMRDAEQAAEDVGDAFNGSTADASMDMQVEALVASLRDVSADASAVPAPAI